MSRSIKDISEELGRMNLEHEKIHCKGKELNLNSGKHNDQYHGRRANTDCVYFVKKGSCRYGSLCRFIHPEKKLVWNPLNTSQDLGTKHSSLDPQRQIPLLGSLKEEASSQVVSGEGQQKAGSLMCRVGSQVLPREGIPNHVPYRIPFPAKLTIPAGSTGLPLRAADSQVLPNRGIPIHVPYRIPFPEKFKIPVGPTGLPLRPDRPVCKYYSHFGLCKYGITCPDDHPIDFQSIAVPVPKRSSKSKDRSK